MKILKSLVILLENINNYSFNVNIMQNNNNKNIKKIK